MNYHRVERVSGPSSYRASRIGLGLLGIWLTCIVAVGVAVWMRPPHPPASYFEIFFSIMGSWMLVSLAIAIVIAIVQIQMRRERQLGYTWASDKYQNLDQIDPESRVVVREAGERFLSTTERLARVARARSWADAEPTSR